MWRFPRRRPPAEGDERMMDDRMVKLIGERIFSDPQMNVYAVLDGASAPGLLQKLFPSGAKYFCVLPGDLEPDMAEVAPYLVQLRADSDLARWVLTEGWGKHWGIFAASPADPRTMRGHFRGLVKVYDEEGKPLIFRYYDPRVLREFLTTCTSDELQEMFGPIAAYYAEAEDPAILLSFSRRGEELAKQEIKLTGK
jgi:hypothetical protein